MSAGSRFGIALVAAALAFAPASAQTANSTTNSPATDAIGPGELRNFSINGTVTRPAPEPAAPTARPAPQPPSRESPAQPGPAASVPAPAPARPQPRVAGPGPAAPSVTMALPPAQAPVEGSGSAEPPANFATQPNEAPPIIPEAAMAPVEQRGSLLPWLLVALLAAGGAGFYAWRQQGRAAVAGHSSALEAFVPAEPAPRPPAPAPRAVPPGPAPASTIVSTRLRPQLEIQFAPARCIIEEQGARIEFEVSLFNSGSAPARDVLLEACMFNAGPAQDQDIGAFFAHPVGTGNRIAMLAPLQSLSLTSSAGLAVDKMKMFEVAGRKLFVPLVGFNALYRWSGGEGQTSASYLVGRDTQGEKMAPFRLDLGPRLFRGLGAREHHLKVRT